MTLNPPSLKRLVDLLQGQRQTFSMQIAVMMTTSLLTDTALRERA